MLGILIMPAGLCSGTRSVPNVKAKARARVPRMNAAVLERRTALAREWILNEGFYAPCKEELMSPDFVFLGPVSLRPNLTPTLTLTISPNHSPRP